MHAKEKALTKMTAPPKGQGSTGHKHFFRRLSVGDKVDKCIHCSKEK